MMTINQEVKSVYKLPADAGKPGKEEDANNNLFEN